MEWSQRRNNSKKSTTERISEFFNVNALVPCIRNKKECFEWKYWSASLFSCPLCLRFAVCQCCSEAHRLLSSHFLRYTTKSEEFLILFRSYILSLFDNGEVVYDNIFAAESCRLENIQMSAAELILGCLQKTSHSKISEDLSMSPLTKLSHFIFFPQISSWTMSYISRRSYP